MSFLDNLLHRNRKAAQEERKPEDDPMIDMHQKAGARRDYMWAGLVNVIKSGKVILIRRYLTRANLVVGNVAEIKDDREFLLLLQSMLKNREELLPLVDHVQVIIDQLES